MAVNGGGVERRRLCFALVASLLVLLFGPGAASEASNLPGDYEQKASLICNFLRNFQWPDRRFARPNAPFIIGIAGTDQISEFLREDIQDRLIQGRPVQIRRVSHREEMAACHLVFISRSERDRLRSMLSDLRREGVLTVGESENFLANGGVVQFTSVVGQVRYQLSLDAARREKIEPNGFVLRMALPQSAGTRTEDRRVAETPTP